MRSIRGDGSLDLLAHQRLGSDALSVRLKLWGHRQHQVCKAHVKRNTQDIIERTLPLIIQDADGSLQAIGVSPEQAVTD